LYGAAILCLASSLLTSCVLHEETISRTEAIAVGDPFVTIELRLQGEPYSYTLGITDENLIQTLDVLVFRQDTDGKEYFLRHVEIDPSAIITDVSDLSGRSKKCAVRVPVSDQYKQRLVFIANAHGAIPNAAVSTPKETLLSGIVFSMGGNWPAENSTIFTPFPMWGESSLLELTGNVTSLSERIYMLRMVARVDIRVDDGLQKNDFELHEVYLYNRYGRGRVVPHTDAVEGAAGTLKVNAPTIPAGAQPVALPVEGDYYTTDGDNLQSITRGIYLMENAATKRLQDATCFVVGGKYRDSGEIRYWRVDLPRQNGGDLSDGFRTFLRNNRYEVIIKAVNGRGYDTPEEAFRLTEWGEVGLDVALWEPVDIIFADNGVSGGTPYTLKASPASFNYLREGTEDGFPGSFSISTSYDYGWTGELFRDGDGSWLQFFDTPSVFSGDKDELKTYEFTVAPTQNGEFHHAYLKITAGNLVKYIDIYQTDLAPNNSSLDFYDWTESDQSAGPADGPYRLGVSATRIDMYMAKSAQGSFLITTDYPGGYATRISGASDWLTINSNGTSEGPVTAQALTFTVADNPVAVSREAVIEVIVGNLAKRIRVVQYMYGDIFAVMEWTESDQSDNTTGGPYRLGVGRTLFEFPKNVQPGVTLAVVTNNPGGYSAEVTKGGDWIAITNPNAVSLQFSVAENNGIAPREGEMCITAGNLKKYITVRQDIIADVSSGGDIPGWEDEEREEPMNGPYTLVLSKQNIVCPEDGFTVSMTVTATASASGVHWTATTTDDDWITFLTPSGAADGVAQPLSFTVTANSTGEMRSGVITVSVIHRGNKLTQEIHVQQYPDSEPMIRPELNDPYVTNQLKRQSFTLYSKKDWAVRLKSNGDPSGILRTLYTTGGKANETGDEVWFALNTFSTAAPPLSGNSPYTVTLEIFSPADEFNPVDVVITVELMPSENP
jgi:hypothetical protein